MTDACPESAYQGLNAAYEYIDSHIGEELNLHRIAQIAGYSEFHFHRLFHAATGTTLHSFLTEQRVAAAARQLLYEKKSVTDIALDCGFSSSSAFVRGFRRCMGCTPSVYRANKERRRPETIISERFRSFKPDPAIDAAVALRELPDLHVAGIVCRGLSVEFSNRDIETAFVRVWKWLENNGFLRPYTRLIGLTLDTPEITALQKCRYFACAEVGEDAKSEGAVTVRTFPTRGKYLCFSLRRDVPDFSDAFFCHTDYLYGRYMPLAALYPDDRPFAEFYRQTANGIEISFIWYQRGTLPSKRSRGGGWLFWRKRIPA